MTPRLIDPVQQTNIWLGEFWQQVRAVGMWDGTEWIIPQVWTGSGWAPLSSQIPSGGPIVPPPVDDFVLRVTRPTRNNSGTIPGTVFTVLANDQVITTPGAIYTDTHFTGNVSVNAAGVSFFNCLFTGRDVGYLSNTDGNIVMCRSTGTYFERCTFRVDYPMPWRNTVAGGGAKLYRCDVSQGVDGFYCNRDKVEAEGSYFHDFYFSNQSENQAGSNPPYWTHNDGIQWYNPSNTQGSRVIGNFFDWYPVENGPRDQTAILETGLAGSAYPRSLRSPKTGRFLWGGGLTVSTSGGAPVTGVTVEDNWFEGGTACFQMNFVIPTGGPMDFGTMGGNRFGHDQYDYGSNSTYQMRYKNGCIVANELTNYWDPEATTVPSELVGKMFAKSFTGGIRVDP